jgi:FkbM family methyltransferase
MQYYSQYRQDEFVDKYFNYQEGGYFLELGAGDGITISNTYFFEKFRNWKGICIEASKDFEKLKINRNCITVNCAVGEEETAKFLELDGCINGLSGLIKYYNSQHKQRIENDINFHKSDYKFKIISVIPLQEILDKHNVNYIDYFSLDVEGAELSVLHTIDFSRTKIKLLMVENNYKEPQVKEFLKTKNYTFIEQSEVGDDIFILK